MTVWRSGELAIRPLADDDHDIEQMARWLSDPAVLEWYEGRDRPFDAARIRAEYAPDVQLAEGVEPGIIEVAGEAVGYVQWYEVARFVEEYGLPPDEDPTDVWAVDLFIGDPSRWGSGLGTAALRLLVDRLLVDRSARQVLIDPRSVNARAIRSYGKVGFRRVRTIPDRELHEGRRWETTLMALDADRDVVGLTAALARIDSINPALVPGAPGEGEVAGRVAAWGAAHGLEVRRFDAAPGRPNVVLVRPGSGGGRSLLFNGHLDTVGVGGPSTAAVRFDDDRVGDRVGRLVGRGVLDTKGGLAAAMAAVVALEGVPLRGDVVIAAVADEEHGSLGTEALVRAWSADAAVVLEPTDLVVVHEHRGFAVIDVVVDGRASHTSRPERGANAVHAAAAVVDAVRMLDAAWAAGADPVRRPSALVSGIRSDGETFTVPPRCHLTVEVRTSGRSPEEEVGAVLAAVVSVSGAVDGCSVSATVSMSRPPLATPVEHPLVSAVCAALDRVGARSTVGAAPYWTDAALHAVASTPAVVIGPVGEGLHEDLEWVDVASLRHLAAAFVDLITTWCT